MPTAVESKVLVTTTGSVLQESKCGGYAAILRYRNHEKELCKAVRDTTEEQIELLGLVVALETLKRPCRVEWISESKHANAAFAEAKKVCIGDWKPTVGETPCQWNPDLWRRLCREVDRHWIVRLESLDSASFRRVERCCQLASDAAFKIKRALDLQSTSSGVHPGMLCRHGRMEDICDICWMERTGGSLR